MLISAYVLPVCLYALAAFLTYRAFTADAWDRIERTAFAAAEHASKVFATDELAGARSHRRTRRADELGRDRDIGRGAQAQEEARKSAEAEEQLREAQRLEAVGQLTGGIAHDFNNVLTVIVGNLDLLARQMAADPGKRLIATMRRAAARGARLTQSLLAFGRRQTLRPEIINPNRLVKEIGELLRARSTRRWRSSSP